MVKWTRLRIGLAGLLSLLLVAFGYVLIKSAFVSERSIRIALEEHLAEWSGATITVAGATDIRYFPRLTMNIQKVSMAGITKLPALQQIEADRLDIRLGLRSLISGTPVVDRITLVNPVVTSRTAAAQANPDAGANAFIGAILTSPFEEIVIENGTLSISGPETREKFTRIAAKLDVKNEQGAHTARGNFVWRERLVKLRYEAGNIAEIADGNTQPINITVGGDQLIAEISGEAEYTQSLRLNGQMELKIPSLSDFAKWVGVLVPDGQTSGNFTANGPFHLTGSRIAFDDGSFALDGNKAIGALALEFGGPRPQIEGTLALQKLDLTKYINPEVTDVTEPAGGSTKIETVDIDFPLMHHLNADLRISTTELIAPPVTAGQSALSLTLNAGRLMADIAIFDVCEGNGNGRLEFDATVPESKFRVTADLSGISAKTCIEFFTPSSHLDGTASVTADLSSRGRSADEILRHLTGKTSIAMDNGIIGLDLARLVLSVRNGSIQGWDAVQGDETEFKEAKGDFFFRRGAAYTDALTINLGDSDLQGEGTIDMAGRTFDLRLSFIDRVPETATGEQSPAKEENAGNEKSVRQPASIVAMKGPWSNPSFKLQPVKSSAWLTPALLGRPPVQ